MIAIIICLHLLVPDLQRLAADRVEDGQEARLVRVLEHPSCPVGPLLYYIILYCMVLIHMYIYIYIYISYQTIMLHDIMSYYIVKLS